MKNPLTCIWQSKSPLGVKVIALSLLLVLVSALPVMLQSIVDTENTGSIVLGWLFAIGALVAHVGFFVGILLLIKDFYFSKK